MDLSLDGLIREVQEAAPEALAQLQVASQLAGRLDELGDALLNHFVDRSRRAGHTWAEIGANLGVTRQAVQKRFVDSLGDGVIFERFTPRARKALEDSAAIARSLSHSYVGTEHQLLALLDATGGVAAEVLGELGIARSSVQKAVLRITPKGADPVREHPALTPRARKVVEESINVAVDLGHNYVGTEHLLLAIYRGQDGLGKTILQDAGADSDVVQAAVVRRLKQITETVAPATKRRAGQPTAKRKPTRRGASPPVSS